MADLNREPEEGYEQSYSGMGFATGEDALDWLRAVLATYPRHHIPVWAEASSPVNPTGPDLSVGVLLPQTGRSMIVYAVTAAQEDIDEARQIVEDTLVGRAASGFAR